MNTGPQETFRALGDPTRRQILIHLSRADMSIGEVATKFTITRGAIQKHLNILQKGSLITVRKVGRKRINHLEVKTLMHVADWLRYFDQFWDERLMNLKLRIEDSSEFDAANDKDNS